MLYINDITECVSSTVKLYADDTKIYREIIDPIIDCQLLQNDLTNISEWARKWQLRFNADKCESMRITHSRDKSVTNYFLGQPLKDVNNFKDLGVTITKDLSWSNHISITVNKANKVLVATTRSTRANHQYKLYVKPARLNCYKNSFFIRIVKLWNELPRNIVEADNLQHFKSKLKLYLNI